MTVLQRLNRTTRTDSDDRDSGCARLLICGSRNDDRARCTAEQRGIQGRARTGNPDSLTAPSDTNEAGQPRLQQTTGGMPAQARDHSGHLCGTFAKHNTCDLTLRHAPHLVARYLSMIGGLLYLDCSDRATPILGVRSVLASSSDEVLF